MSSRLPSIAALQCFLASAKYLSFTQAAKELCLTQSAVSLQIKKLEQQLGCLLFARVRQRLQITPAGEQYAAQVELILKQLEQATQAVSQRLSGRLKIGIEDSLTTRWLIPRLADFQARYPEIETQIISDLQKLYERQEGFDIGVLYGDGQWSGYDAKLLMPEAFVAVCHPSLKAQYGEVHALGDVLNYPFLHHSSQPSSTDYWLGEAGLSEVQISQLAGQRFEHFEVLVDAVKYGLGLTILPAYIADQELQKGQLVRASDRVLTSRESYFVVVHQQQRHDAHVQAFVDWLLGV